MDLLVYLIFLGWKILGSFSSTNKESGRPLKFYEAALFQFINPKAWVVALTAATAFFPNEETKNSDDKKHLIQNKRPRL